MDASPLFDPQYLPVIAVTLLGFAALAAALLVPIWRFLNREQEVAEEWTPEAVEERLREHHAENAGNEAPSPDESVPERDAPDASGTPPG
jgi:hypothetical protein